MDDVDVDVVTFAEMLLVRLCRGEYGRTSQQQGVCLRMWQPNSARKSVVRQFVGLWLEDRPLYVAKIPLTSEDHKVAREFAILQELTVLGVPIAEPLQPIGRGFVMRYLGSDDLPTVLRGVRSDQGWRSFVELVVDSMVVFHRRVLVAGSPRRPEVVAVDYVDDWCSSDGVVRGALARAQVGGAHGDLGPWNIRYDQATQTLGFLDWEDFRAQGLPAFDVLNFLFTLPLIFYPDYAAIGFERLCELVFFEDNGFGDLVAFGLNRYARAMGVAARDLCALVPVYCQAMVVRFLREGRSVDHLFYVPFQRRFRLDGVAWLPKLDVSV